VASSMSPLRNWEAQHVTKAYIEGGRTLSDTFDCLAPLLKRVEIVEAELVAGDTGRF
jgi:hypothetical protein